MKLTAVALTFALALSFNQTTHGHVVTEDDEAWPPQLREALTAWGPLLMDRFNIDLPNISLQDLLAIVQMYLTPHGPGVSKQCTLDGLKYLQGIVNQSLWALQMLDANPLFPPSGVLGGNMIHFPGSFESCTNVDAQSFVGQYCLMGTYPVDFGGKTVEQKDIRSHKLRSAHKLMETRKSPSGNNDKFKYPFDQLRLGHCTPSSCTQEDITAGSVNLDIKLASLGLINITKPINLLIPFACHNINEETPLENDDWAMICILVIFGLLIITGTLMDALIVFLKVDKFPLFLVQLFRNFSIYHNTRKIFNMEVGKDNLSCINGIRFLSISWVLLGHTYQMILYTLFIGNLPKLFEPDGPFSSTAFAAVVNATPSVDTFFLIGATLLSYHTLKELDRSKGGNWKTWLVFYVHRYLRLTGVYAIIIGLHATLLKFITYQPNSYVATEMHDLCHDNWWWNILYINNFQPDAAINVCLGQTWYMANDMQFFIISPIFIYSLWRSKIFGLILGGAAVVASIVTPTVISYVTEQPYNGDFEDFYIKPWNRFQPYIVGLLLGYVIHKLKGKKLPVSQITNLIIWGAAVAVGAAVIYGNSDSAGFSAQRQPALLETTFYNGFNRFAWSVAVGWVILACVKGKGGPINQLLSWGGFVPLARLSYCIYLLHITVIFWNYASVMLLVLTPHK